MSDTREPSHNAFSSNNNSNNSNSFRGRGRGRGGFESRGDHQPIPQERAEAANETKALLEGFISRRYNAENKYLDFSSIVSDEPVLKSGMFENERTQKKFFPALMVVCDTMLPTRKAKIDAIDSISLANNGVQNLNVIYELVNYMNHIKNLDLSNNALPSLDKLKPWKGRYKFLEHLIVDPFPEMNWEDEITSWFPTLRKLNNKQVRPDPPGSAAIGGGAQTMIATHNPAPLVMNPSPPMTQSPPIMSEDRAKEEMIVFVQQATNLNRHYAVQCLEAGQWNLQQASDLFASSKHTLPPEAFGP